METVRTKAFQKNILAALRFATDLALGRELGYVDSGPAGESPRNFAEFLYWAPPIITT